VLSSPYRQAVTKRIAIFLASVAVLVIGPTPAAQADTATKLPFTSGSPWLAVDPSEGHVFVSGGVGNSSIVVLNYAGKIVKTITGEGGASQMALDPTTHTLYVALHDASAISEIDTQTLTETKRFSTAPYPNPSSVVIAGGKLWFSCQNAQAGCLVSANLDGTGMTTPIPGRSAPLFLAAGGSDNHLLAFGDSQETPNLYVYDVSGNTPSLVSYSFAPNASGAIADMTFEPSGSNLLLASGAPYYIQSLATGTLTSGAEYPTGPYPISVAVSADGSYVAGGINAANGPNVFVYPVGGTTRVRTWQIGDDNGSAIHHALAFSPDASKLFTVSSDSTTGHLAFDVLTRPTVHLTATGISLHRSAESVVYGRRTRLRAHVAGAESGKVELFARTGVGRERRVATGTLKAGAVTFGIKPKRTAMYYAQLEQGLTYASSTSQWVAVEVAPALSVTTHPDGFLSVQGQRFARTRVIVHVRPHVPLAERLAIFAQVRERGHRTPIATNGFRIGKGVVKAYFVVNRPGILCRVRAEYSGNGTFAGSKSAWKRFHAPG
jgi:hypothetical protein